MPMIGTLIVDDEPLSLRRIRDLLWKCRHETTVPTPRCRRGSDGWVLR
jgi:hypothetical protein